MNLHSSTILAPEPPAKRAQPGLLAVGTREFFLAFFRALETRGIAYVILPGYDSFPDRVTTGVDYAVANADLPKVRAALDSVARAHGWVVAQTWQNEVFAYYSVVIDPENPANHLALDACSHFAKNRCLLLRDEVLLDAPRRHPRGFSVPAPATEFIYLLARGFAKNKPAASFVPRLRELSAHDVEGAFRRFTELFGVTARSLDDCLKAISERPDELRAALQARSRYGAGLQIAEGWRRTRRALQAPGLHIAVLGPDGAGKSTLIENVGRTLTPCFTQQRVYKFRPDVFGRIEPETNPAPHDRAPRHPIVSWAKVFYYFVDWWLGWFARLLPARMRGGLAIFDRSFDDLIIDQRRYLVQRSGALARLLRLGLPRADRTFILDAEPAAVHARKPELPVAVIERQRQAYQKLAQENLRCRLVCANQPARAVTTEVSRDLILLLAARERRRRRATGKRLFDLAVAIPALVLLAPLLLAIAFLVSCILGTPVVFRQVRPGLHGAPFTIWKFRTMTDARDDSGRLLPDADRLTRFGKFLRSTSLDELPELWNVIRGDMSLVGPRPLLVEYLPLYSPEQSRRHDVLPGITGWAQINGRNAASWPQKFKLDVWYVENQSIWLDVKIIARTIFTVIRREGINQPGRATADRFLGSNEPEASV